MDPIDTKRIYRLVGRLMLKPDGDVTLAFDPETLAVHQLNPTLARVAELLDGQRPTEQVVIALSESLEIGVDDASREVYRALQALRSEQLIEACG
ncbi:MAG: PqqD family protein [Deltaproteobacteria bacterium]|nr:PqqD family protein [Deltaproteobacteria bacterium]MBW2420780.1 PqqD family protein [Deltaproteobacteria bacterium]